MRKKAIKAGSLSARLARDGLFISQFSPSLALRQRFFHISQLDLLGVPRNLIRVVFYGTTIAVVVLFLLLCISYFAVGNTYVAPRLIICSIVLLYVGVIGHLISTEKFKIAAWLLIGLYAAIATVILWIWSINAQVGLLMLGFIIILASTLLGATYILPFTAGVIALLCLLQALTEIGIANPNTAPLANSPTFADVVGYGVIFSIFALISWLSRRQMEQALRRALGAEAALEQEKKLLAVRLEEQTNHLREVQLAEMHQLYKFAELGQLSTVVLHELANYLTILTLDIDDISERHQQSQAITNAKESIGHLDAMVDQVRRRLQDTNEVTDIDAVTVVKDTLETLRSKLLLANVVLTIKKDSYRHKNRVLGDPLVLGQVITILVNNAIDALATTPSKTRKIDITIESKAKFVVITVADTGAGIPNEQRGTLFEPFKTTKAHGMGVGLYIAKKMIESHFQGTLTLHPSVRKTSFIIRLPTFSH